MKAAVYLGKESIEVREVEKPEAKNGEVLVKVKSCAICGTDIRTYFHGHHAIKPPHILGHEVAGEIVEIGEDVEGYNIGEMVHMVTEVGCGKCRFCMSGRHNLCPDLRAMAYYYPGGFAEYILIPRQAVIQRNLIPIPDNLSFDEATLAEPLSCCINAQEYLNITFGNTVLIVGAGPIGCMHVELARLSGATKIILADISDERLEIGKRFGRVGLDNATLFINSGKEDLIKKVKEETNGDGADVIITACPSPEMQEQALQMVATRGRISFFGGLPGGKTITIDSNIIHYKEISVFGAFASSAPQYKQALALLASGNIKGEDLITHRFPLGKIKEALEVAKSGKGLKVIVKP
ncbi:alcohol dehydrogenase [Candidatus Desantisbacteria bacterium CG07_land_8_20_14_0_80_39_15]|uniref:Alcohol dehydrogenase n=1 Tax=Candidatus Desantisbacteria bacterium CG07_land_8_20_14_0_80_39_15 TaxID=1974549 RepID=A0A2M6ZG61_9BACT|nr:MAG: alcohol dehydrogenase [Candidatus Desantisbacteria bacterium CG07_land_8_20_14_0_80_39_15]